MSKWKVRSALDFLMLFCHFVAQFFCFVIFFNSSQNSYFFKKTIIKLKMELFKQYGAIRKFVFKIDLPEIDVVEHYNMR